MDPQDNIKGLISFVCSNSMF